MLLKAFAKINWSLDITGTRPDGYHLLDMIMQPISIADDIVLSPAPDLAITTGGYPRCAADSSNLAYRAAELLRNQFKPESGVHISLHKRIPIGAGLGGGSADAAAVLFGLNRLWNLNLSQDILESFGLQIGADVPFCLRGGLARVRGIGEIIESEPCCMDYRLLVLQPCRGLSTRAVYTAWHQLNTPSRPDTENVLKALSDGNPSLLAGSMHNVLEPVSAAQCPEIPEAVEKLLSAGAFAAQMSGSGSAVFGAFRSKEAAEKARKELSGQYKNVYLCHSQTDSIRLMED